MSEDQEPPPKRQNRVGVTLIVIGIIASAVGAVISVLPG